MDHFQECFHLDHNKDLDEDDTWGIKKLLYQNNNQPIHSLKYI